MATRLLQRQVLPLDRDTDVMALYVDPEEARLDADKYQVGGNRAAKELNQAAIRQTTSTGASVHPDQIESRTALRVHQGQRLSFGTYFNAFPASYWRRWTVVSNVRLTVEVSGRGATLIVYRSLANGRSQRVDSATTGGEAKGTFVFDLTLTPFIDGGCVGRDEALREHLGVGRDVDGRHVDAAPLELLRDPRRSGEQVHSRPSADGSRHRSEHRDERPIGTEVLDHCIADYPGRNPIRR